jgi:hypothetical protein
VTLRLADRWVWDFWVAREGASYHVFYLQAPRELVKQDLRHWSAYDFAFKNVAGQLIDSGGSGCH